MTASPAMPAFEPARRVPGRFVRALTIGLLACLVVSANGCIWTRTALIDPGTNAQALVDRAEEAQAAGDHQHARELLEQARQADSDNPELNRLLARALRADGDAEKALVVLRELLADDHLDVRGRLLMADILIEQGALPEASSVLDEALAAEPDSLEALLLKGRIAEMEDRDGLALECYHRVLGSDPENIVARLRIAELQIRAERPDRAAPLLRSICQCHHVTPDQLAEARWQLGIAYGRERRWAEAADELSGAMALRRHATADDWYRIAFAHRMAGNDRAATDDLQHALELDPAHPAALAMSTALSGSETSRPAIQPAGFVLAGAPAPAGW